MNFNKIRERIVRASFLSSKVSPASVENALKHLRVNSSGTLELDLTDDYVLEALIEQVEEAYIIDHKILGDADMPSMKNLRHFKPT
ncbi:hypothetical protein A28LD_2312 [Idiomarina sp. A28L]|uniref:hypothetical protein n=1 Tax=Idiomarina sp. A28L TaxID=1036674 RepID=UPI00021385F3|nr:hypothetical protein [Idiomarina sp. A28L]EGN74220.1 hypothetical protein A28LD_2312 [Idiomarina sp. A28L]